MIKIIDYSLVNGSNGDFQNITFLSDSGYKLTFTVSEDGGTYFDANSITISEYKEAVAMIESGKLEIELIRK